MPITSTGPVPQRFTAADAVSGIRSSADRLSEAARRLEADGIDLEAAQSALARLGELEVAITRHGLRRRPRRAPPHKKI